MIYVLYHGNCYDGFGAAYAAWKKFGDKAKYLAVTYGNPVPEMPGAKEVYIVDFSYPRAIIEELAEKAPLTVLDHHKTAEADLAPLIRPDGFEPRVVFDMNRSGALITWEYLHRTEAPRLIQHISDRDLWQFKIPGSKEVHAALVSTPFDFEVWDKLDVDQLIRDGAGCIKFQSQLVKNIVSGAWMTRVGDFTVPTVNTASSWSEVGEALCEAYPDAPFAASFTVMKNSVMWSLRSRGEFDVSAVAKKFGGGGHKNAAGFKSVRV
jgi:oligoribonuclease NrnB/cAMP/cGMP phosphodiesterase (DHH superfamily)